MSCCILGAWLWTGYGLVNGFIDHLYTSLGTTLYRSVTQTIVLSLLQSPPTVSWQRLLPREIHQLPALRSSCRSCPSRTLVNWQFNKLGPRLAAKSDQPSSLLSLTNPLLHVTSLNWTADNWLQLDWCPLYIILGRIQQKTPPPKILLLFPWRLPSNKLDIVSVGKCIRPLLRNGCLLIHLLHTNGCTRRPFRGICSATGLYAIICYNAWWKISYSFTLKRKIESEKYIIIQRF
jgi:hypothetical protein